MSENLNPTNDTAIPTSKSIRELIDWQDAVPKCANNQHHGRLVFPPIQRGIVWRNEQIINFWDSLLRGFPVGVMTIHSLQGSKNWNLFDGQQRLSTILLGAGLGKMSLNTKIFINLSTPVSKTGRKFEIRICTTGQPLGYNQQNPNAKFPLQTRREAQLKFMEEHKIEGSIFNAVEAFDMVDGSDLIHSKAKATVKFSEIMSDLLIGLNKTEIVNKYVHLNELEIGTLEEFVQSLSKCLENSIHFQNIDQEIVNDPQQYQELFQRMGQGGTRLSEDDLMYSIVKHEIPPFADAIAMIVKENGKIVSEIDLALAAIRIAKFNSPGEYTEQSQIFTRPNVQFVSKMAKKDSDYPESLKYLKQLIENKDSSQLFQYVQRIRKLLKQRNECDIGFPAILLSRISSELFDVLLLIVSNVKENELEQNRKNIIAFTLYWMVFVADQATAGRKFFESFKVSNKIIDINTLKDFVKKIEMVNISVAIPRPGEPIQHAYDIITSTRDFNSDFSKLFEPLNQGYSLSPSAGLAFFFRAADHYSDNHRAKSALLWLQRKLFHEHFQNYDPTMGRDEDLPVDVDHIIPNDSFNRHWKTVSSNAPDNLRDKPKFQENFRWQRDKIGNTVGNLRWLDASKNRSKGARSVAEEDDVDLEKFSLVGVKNPYDPHQKSDWDNKKFNSWNWNNILLFQKLVLCRSLNLYNEFLTQSGICDLLDELEKKTDDALN